MCLFSDFQFGFRSSRSTADLLTVVSERIARAFNKSGATIWVVALDITKAFDRVSHADLLRKLKSWNFRSDIWPYFFFSVIDGFKWFGMESLLKNIQLKLKFLKAPFLVLHFSCYILMNLPDDVICNIAIYVEDTTLYSKCDQASDLWQQLELASQL